MKTIVFNTNKDPILERLIIKLAIDLGFKDPNPEFGVEQGKYGLVATEGCKQLSWTWSTIYANRVIDVGSTSTLDLIKALKNIKGEEAITMPFTIYNKPVDVYPRKKIVIGCETLTASRIKNILKTYCPDAARQCPDDEGKY